jgi:hypothetical protein
MSALSWPSSQFARSKVAYSLFAFSILATILLRVDIIARKVTFSHDEGISFLSATCHQGEYNRVHFGVPPAPASTWKALLRVDQRFCFQQISADLGKSDIHPPLYFWLLHVWSLIWGVEVWTGPLLNSLFAVANVFILYRLAGRVLRRREDAVLVTYTYALNYSVIAISGLARQYDLLTFLSLLLIWIAVRYGEQSQPGWHQAWPFFILATGGMLTHYHFFLPLTGCALYLGMKLHGDHVKSLAIVIASVGLGFAAALWIHPYFLSSFDRELGNFGVFMFSSESFGLRFLKLAASFSAYYYVIILSSAVILALGLRKWRRPSARVRYLSQVDKTGQPVLFFSLWLAGGVALLYLTSITPLHQMSAKYFAMAWPFLSFAPVFVLRCARYRTSVALALYLFPLSLSLALAVQGQLTRAQEVDPGALLSGAEVVLVDNITRGLFPRIVWHVADDSQVIAAEQEYLLSQPESWMGYLPEDFTYVSEVSYASTLTGQLEVITLLENAGYSVVPVGEQMWDAGTVFEVKKQSVAP